MIVCTVTPTIMDGTVVRWYRSEIAAEMHRVMVSASRNGVQVGEHLTNGEVPVEVMDRANAAHEMLIASSDADLSGWATHRRGPRLGSELVPICREATETPEESAAIVDANLRAMGSAGLTPGEPS